LLEKGLRDGSQMTGERGMPFSVMQVRLFEGEQGAQGNGDQWDGGKVRQPRRKDRSYHAAAEERADDQGQTIQHLHLAQVLLKGVTPPGFLK
jgi:hypothetical protein